MRQFVVHGRETPTDPDFALDDLASGAGRLDLLARSLIAGLLLSHDIRADVRVHLVLADELTVTFDGSELRSLHPDERSAAALIRAALDRADQAVGRMAVEASPGVTVERARFEDTLRELADAGTLVTLRPDGTRSFDVEPPADPIFVLSDTRPFSDDELSLLAELGAEPISLGPRALHTDQAITVAHSWCDTNGWTRW